MLGCLIGAYWTDRHEHFDEEHIFNSLEKILPTVEVVRDSVYFHPTKQGLIHLIYFEIERRDRQAISIARSQNYLEGFHR